MAVESLPYPKNSVFEPVKRYFPHLRSQGFRPPDEPLAWKTVRLERRHEELASILPEGGRMRRFLLVRENTLLRTPEIY